MPWSSVDYQQIQEIVLRCMPSTSPAPFSYSAEATSSPRRGLAHSPVDPNLAEYEYKPITLGGQRIRVLKLFAGTPGNPTIDCEIVETQLDAQRHIKYEALSWCWGTLPETDYIRIRGKGRSTYAKSAKPDLVNALLALRDHKRDRYLWIDAVCIDQENLDEKNEQVEMMAEIYGKAKRVLIWLGEPDQSSRVAINFIRDEVLKLQDFDDLCDNERNSPKWKALLDLMQRPWFSRRWVVQEIALAQKALIYCGGEDKISWNKFSIAVELFVEVETATHRLSEVMKKDRTFHHIPGWFDYVSQLGASLLVDATGRLFRDHKDLNTKTISKKIENRRKERKEAERDSDIDDLSDDSDDGQEAQEIRAGDDATNGIARMSKSPLSSVGVRVNELASTVKGQPLLGLEVLVSGLAIFDVTKAHDSIYALLAISKDTTPKAKKRRDIRDHTQAALEQFTEQRRYEVDYKKPYVDVCQYFIKFCIQRAVKVDATRALDIILRPWAVEEAKVWERFELELGELEDLEEKRRKEAAKKKADTPMEAQAVKPPPAEELKAQESEIEKRRKQYVYLPSWVPQLSRAPFAMQRTAGVTGEKVGRINADPLVGLPSQNMRNYKAAETKELDIRTLKFRKRTGRGKDDNYYSLFVKGFVLDTITEVKDASQSGNIPSEWADLADWDGIKGDPPDEFWRTLVGDRGRDGRNPPVYYARACKESFEKGGVKGGSISTSDLIRNERVSVIAQFCWRVQSVIWKRALAKTESGKLALVPPGVQKGDLVCILYGCSVPVILRMSERKTKDAIAQEADLELETLANHMQACAKNWLVRTKHHQEKRETEKERYRAWKAKATMSFQKEKEDKKKWDWTNARPKRKWILEESGDSTMAMANRFIFPAQPSHKLLPEELGIPNSAEKSGPARRIFYEKRRPLLLKGYDQYLHDCEFDDWRRQKKEKAREGRDLPRPSPDAKIDTWDEPKVNWRKFELRLKYGRRWRKFVEESQRKLEKEAAARVDEQRKSKGWAIRPRKEEKEFVESPTDSGGRLTDAAAETAKKAWLLAIQPDIDAEPPDELPQPQNGERTASKTPITDEYVEKSRQSSHFSYKLLGDCYLHGMMDGEAMAVQNGHASEKAIPAVVFEIR